MTQSYVSDNMATGQNAVGGGLYNDGPLTITASTFDGNVVGDSGATGGGAIYNDGVYWGVDRAANTAVSVSVWEEHPDEIPAYKALVREFSLRAQEYVSGSPTVDTYEVAQQV